MFWLKDINGINDGKWMIIENIHFLFCNWTKYKQVQFSNKTKMKLTILQKNDKTKLTILRKNAKIKLTILRKGRDYLCFREKYIVNF